MTNSYILGLDLGTNSIGWSAVTVDSNGNPNGILDMGVRIFSDGRDPQSKASRAVDRRVARGARRRRDRYLRRRANLLENLVILNLMPEDENARAELWGWSQWKWRCPPVPVKERVVPRRERV